MIVHAGSPRAFWLVFLGGAVGGASRYGLGLALPERPHGFPATTLAINVLGCFALAFLVTGVASRADAPAWIRPALGTGLLGGFTTFSAVTHALDLLQRSGQTATAAGYVTATLVLGLGAATLGYDAGEWWTRRNAFREDAAPVPGGH